MEHTRIQKLLLSEYCDFSETLLLESPFAETTRDGQGLREVALGLTPSKLVIAADVLKKNSDFKCPPHLDPSIESFELVSIYPLEFVTLSVFRRKRRRTLKARLIDGRAKYYELGGMHCRSIFWTLWCKHVRELLSAKENSSSLSETTAASSSSSSTLYLLSSGVEFDGSYKTVGSGSTCRVWAHYGGGDSTVSWRQKDLYLGPSYNELSHGYYTPIPVRFAGASLEDLRHSLKDFSPKQLTCKKTCDSWPCGKSSKSRGRNRATDKNSALCDVLFTREHRNGRKSLQNGCEEMKNLRRATASETSALLQSRLNSCKSQIAQKRRSGSPRKQLVQKLSRFGFGVHENCSSGLYLQPWRGDRDHFNRAKSYDDPRELIESGVRVWEEDSRSGGKLKHPRRYALSTAAHFLRAFGPWPVQAGERISVQRRRASSAVEIRRQPVEPELRLPVSKRQLTASVSMTSLAPGKSGATGTGKGQVVIFWTPEYWYRPRAASAAYRELQKHLSLLRNFRVDKERTKSRKFFCRSKRSAQGDCKESTTSVEDKSILSRIFSKDNKKVKQKECSDSGTSELKRLLRMDLRITAWDLDSTTIAKQLTIIDRDLFLRIPCVEIQVLVFEKSSRNAPNVGAWIAFSHRISCLSASEILATKKLDMRTRLLSRFINAAEKCYDFGNFQSCRSILAGLESPPIYRLKATWSRLRTHHSTRYETMERLCKIFRNTGSRAYRKAWNRCEKRPPVLPYVDDLLERILGDLEQKNRSETFKWKNRPCSHPLISSKYSQEKIAETEESRERKENIEDVAQGRQSLSRRIFSTAIMRIRHGKSSSCQESKDSIAKAREKIIALRAYKRWREFVVRAKIRAEIQTELRGMDRRRRKVLDISNWLTECQRHCRGYDFPGHSLGWEFLLKARYREERDNFFVSLKLEPPCG